MTLADTVKGMNSEDWKERFKAEYWQTKIRLGELSEMIIRCEADTLNFEPYTPQTVFETQARHMKDYLHVLEIRAKIEHINLVEDGGITE